MGSFPLLYLNVLEHLAGSDFPFQENIRTVFSLLFVQHYFFLTCLNHLSLFFTPIVPDSPQSGSSPSQTVIILRLQSVVTSVMSNDCCLFGVVFGVFVYMIRANTFVPTGLANEEVYLDVKVCQNNRRNRFFFKHITAKLSPVNPLAHHVTPLLLFFGNHFFFWAGDGQLPWWTCCHLEQTKVFAGCGAFKDKHCLCSVLGQRKLTNDHFTV